MHNLQLIKNSITSVPDWPKKRIIFRDITTLIADPVAFQETIDALVAEFRDRGFTKVVGTESRGFLFGVPVALALKLPFVPVRKKGKLPRETVSVKYSLEYGEDCLEMCKDAINQGDRVLVIDDLLATGGTLAATAQLIREMGGECVQAGFVINLKDLPGKARLESIGVNTFALVEFEGE